MVIRTLTIIIILVLGTGVDPGTGDWLDAIDDEDDVSFSSEESSPVARWPAELVQYWQGSPTPIPDVLRFAECVRTFVVNSQVRAYLFRRGQDTAVVFWAYKSHLVPQSPMLFLDDLNVTDPQVTVVTLDSKPVSIPPAEPVHAPFARIPLSAQPLLLSERGMSIPVAEMLIDCSYIGGLAYVYLPEESLEVKDGTLSLAHGSETARPRTVTLQCSQSITWHLSDELPPIRAQTQWKIQIRASRPRAVSATKMAPYTLTLNDQRVSLVTSKRDHIQPTTEQTWVAFTTTRQYPLAPGNTIRLTAAFDGSSVAWIHLIPGTCAESPQLFTRRLNALCKDQRPLEDVQIEYRDGGTMTGLGWGLTLDGEGNLVAWREREPLHRDTAQVWQGQLTSSEMHALLRCFQENDFAFQERMPGIVAPHDAGSIEITLRLGHEQATWVYLYGSLWPPMSEEFYTIEKELRGLYERFAGPVPFLGVGHPEARGERIP